VHWLNVTHLEDVGNDETFEDPNPDLPPGRVRIGVNVDRQFEGPGVKITSVAEDSPAAAMELEAGDLIVGLDDHDIEGLQDLVAALGDKAHGDAFTLHVRRGEETLHLDGAFPEAEPRKPFRRPLPWSAVDARVAGNTIDVKVKRVGSFDLFLSDELLDLSKPVVVKVNGETVHEGTVPPDVEFMLQQGAWDEDRALVYRARLRVDVPRKAAD
jgi:hypothetical protein